MAGRVTRAVLAFSMVVAALASSADASKVDGSASDSGEATQQQPVNATQAKFLLPLASGYNNRLLTPTPPAAATGGDSGASATFVGGATGLLDYPSVTLPVMPFAAGAFRPEISYETITLHYYTHQKTYVTRVNGWMSTTLDNATRGAVQRLLVAYREQAHEHDVIAREIAALAAEVDAADGGTAAASAAVPGAAKTTADDAAAVKKARALGDVEGLTELERRVLQATIAKELGIPSESVATPAALAAASETEIARLAHGQKMGFFRSLITFLYDYIGSTAAAAPEAEGTAPTYVFPAFVKNFAGQIFNHAFYFASLSEDPIPLETFINNNQHTEGSFAAALINSFDTVGAFEEKFTAAAVAHFGSGWAWLAAEVPRDFGGGGATAAPLKLRILDSHDAAIVGSKSFDASTTSAVRLLPLAVCDVWEHAYYVDYRANRTAYATGWLRVADWRAISNRYDALVRSVRLIERAAARKGAAAAAVVGSSAASLYTRAVDALWIEADPFLVAATDPLADVTDAAPASPSLTQLAAQLLRQALAHAPTAPSQRMFMPPEQGDTYPVFV